MNKERSRIVEVLKFVELNFDGVSVDDVKNEFEINWRTAKLDLSLLVSLGLITKFDKKYKVLDGFTFLVNNQEVGLR